MVTADRDGDPRFGRHARPRRLISSVSHGVPGYVEVVADLVSLHDQVRLDAQCLVGGGHSNGLPVGQLDELRFERHGAA